MATYSGRFGRVTVDVSSTETLIGHINTWSVNVSAGSTDTSSFGDVWGESGRQSSTGSLTPHQIQTPDIELLHIIPAALPEV
jgi:hypothetical protein